MTDEDRHFDIEELVTENERLRQLLIEVGIDPGPGGELIFPDGVKTPATRLAYLLLVGGQRKELDPHAYVWPLASRWHLDFPHISAQSADRLIEIGVAEIRDDDEKLYLKGA
jgi:hypothetical protein